MKNKLTIPYIFTLLFLFSLGSFSIKAEDRCSAKFVLNKKGSKNFCVLYLDGEEWRSQFTENKGKDGLGGYFYSY